MKKLLVLVCAVTMVYGIADVAGAVYIDFEDVALGEYGESGGLSNLVVGGLTFDTY